MLVQNVATFEAQISCCYPTCFRSICSPPVQNQSELHLPQEKTYRVHTKTLNNQHCLTCCWSRDAHSFAPSFTQCWGYSFRQRFCCLRREVALSCFSGNVLGVRHAAAPGYIRRQRQQACEPMACNMGIWTAVVTGTLSLVVFVSARRWQMNLFLSSSLPMTTV